MKCGGSSGLLLDEVGDHFTAEEDEGDAAAGVGGASGEEDVAGAGGAERRAKEGGADRVGGPTVERAVISKVARGEVAGGEGALGDDAFGKVVDAEAGEALEDDVAVGGGLGGGPGLEGIAGGSVDEDEEVVVAVGRVGGVGAGADGDVDGGFGGRDFLAMDLVEFVGVVVGEEDVVMGEAGVASADAEEQDEAGGGERGAVEFGAGVVGK